MPRQHRKRFWSRSLLIVTGAIAELVLAGLTDRTLAQITADGTLGAERSIVNRNAPARGGNADRIEGGAQRGTNLFHSFQGVNDRPWITQISTIENSVVFPESFGNAGNIVITKPIFEAPGGAAIGLLFREAAVVPLKSGPPLPGTALKVGAMAVGGTLFYNKNGSQSGFGTGGMFADLANGLKLSRSSLAVVQ